MGLKRGKPRKQNKALPSKKPHPNRQRSELDYQILIYIWAPQQQKTSQPKLFSNLLGSPLTFLLGHFLLAASPLAPNTTCLKYQWLHQTQARLKMKVPPPILTDWRDWAINVSFYRRETWSHSKLLTMGTGWRQKQTGITGSGYTWVGWRKYGRVRDWLIGKISSTMWLNSTADAWRWPWTHRAFTCFLRKQEYMDVLEIYPILHL